jgi:hypothetical protein
MFPLLLSLFLLHTPLAHEFKMSICEVAYQPSDQHFEVKVFLFMDDLTEAVTGDAKAALPAREQIEQYVQTHFQLHVDGQKQVLSFYAMRQKEEQVMLQFSAPALAKAPQKVGVANNIMLEKFGEQTNMVYLLVPGNSKQAEALDVKKTWVEFGM